MPNSKPVANSLQALKGETATLIFYEAPHRVLACLRDMATVFGPQRQVVMAQRINQDL